MFVSHLLLPVVPCVGHVLDFPLFVFMVITSSVSLYVCLSVLSPPFLTIIIIIIIIIIMITIMIIITMIMIPDETR